MSLACTDLSITRGSRLALESVSTSLEAGQITAIVGPNGAGKSTLLMGLAGLLAPAAGSVSLGGESLAAIAPRERAMQIGYLPQAAEVAWDVAVENLVALGRMPHRDRGTEPVEAAIDIMDLGNLRKRPASRLSGGEKSRALLARVLAGEPDWILADEPLAALDLGHQITLIDHLKSCAAAGTGVVIVLHDLAMAMNHADRVLVLREGRLVADAPPATALSHEVIANGWGVDAVWLGEPGRQALVANGRD
ncbi:ABC transporter ATP-binding protein [uncultured Erythrobacter sp.]|uniref:ABC transporter ATP-binding protein n=1 Tax=uncultured Erythrobacter sp. TaxID=263913 RepID=UPI00262EC5DB|nr:ABC transporter ATP-binding protein [uncultured Erythrobacter sp.]